jgi:hypothetical protein
MERGKGNQLMVEDPVKSFGEEKRRYMARSGWFSGFSRAIIHGSVRGPKVLTFRIRKDEKLAGLSASRSPQISTNHLSTGNV